MLAIAIFVIVMAVLFGCVIVNDKYKKEQRRGELSYRAVPHDEF